MKKEDLYQLRYGCSSMPSGKYMIFQATVKFILEKYTEKLSDYIVLENAVNVGSTEENYK